MDANQESQAPDMFAPDVDGEAANESMPQGDTANPNDSISESQDDPAGRLDALTQENANLRKGVNPILDENKALKAELDSYKSSQAQEQPIDESLSAEYDRLDIATNTKLRQEIENVKADLKREEQIKQLNLGEHAKTLESLMKLPENNGRTPLQVASDHRLGDLAKIAEARSKGIIGNSPEHTNKDYTNPDSINFDDDGDYKTFINSNSSGGGTSPKFTAEG